MFQNLKSKNSRKSKYIDLPTSVDSGFNHASGATTFTIKGNEASRLVRCRICGFPCDTERDPKAPDNSWAGLGINYGVQLTAGTSIGDRRVPSATGGATTVDQYYDRVVTGGCPFCGCYTYYL